MRTEAILRALGDNTRLRIMRLLGTMELAVGELSQVLQQSQPRVSRHASILCDAGLAAGLPSRARAVSARRTALLSCSAGSAATRSASDRHGSAIAELRAGIAMPETTAELYEVAATAMLTRSGAEVSADRARPIVAMVRAVSVATKRFCAIALLNLLSDGEADEPEGQ